MVFKQEHVFQSNFNVSQSLASDIIVYRGPLKRSSEGFGFVVWTTFFFFKQNQDPINNVYFNASQSVTTRHELAVFPKLFRMTFYESFRFWFFGLCLADTQSSITFIGTKELFS